jgi:ATPase subunit of ABC transporter with duplicated ATPase domains
MPYNRNAAQKLLTSAELALFDAGNAAALATHDRRTLVAKVERTRKLRDKYRDLYRRQRLAIRERTGSKRGVSGAANERTKQKEALFADLLGRFQARLEKVSAAEKRAAEREARKQAAAVKKAGRTARKGPGAAARSAKAPAKFGAGAKRGARKGAKAAAPRAKTPSVRSVALRAHQRSAGRRAQVRRDRRS